MDHDASKAQSDRPAGAPGAGRNPLDVAIVVAGALVLILSFTSYYTIDLSGVGGGSDSVSAWHGWLGTAATVLALAGAAAVGLVAFAPDVRVRYAHRSAATVALLLASLCTVIAFFTNAYDDHGVAGVDTGHGFGYWSTLILVLAATGMSWTRLKQTGGALPSTVKDVSR